LAEHVLSQLRRAENAGILVVTVPGNHDEITYHDSVYRQYGDSRRWPGILVRNPMPERCIKGKSKAFQFASTLWLIQAALLRLAAYKLPREERPGLHIGVFHGSLDWDMVGDRSLPLDSKGLRQQDMTM